MGTIELVYYQDVLVASLISYLNYLENSCDDELLLKE